MIVIHHTPLLAPDLLSGNSIFLNNAHHILTHVNTKLQALALFYEVFLAITQQYYKKHTINVVL